MTPEIIRSGTKFKITITSDKQLRIKIPDINTGKNTDLWVAICTDVLAQMEYNNFSSKFTLRGKADINPNAEFYSFTLSSKHSSGTTTYEFKCLMQGKEVQVLPYIEKEIV